MRHINYTLQRYTIIIFIYFLISMSGSLAVYLRPLYALS